MSLVCGLTFPPSLGLHAEYLEKINWRRSLARYHTSMTWNGCHYRYFACRSFRSNCWKRLAWEAGYKALRPPTQPATDGITVELTQIHDRLQVSATLYNSRSTSRLSRCKCSSGLSVGLVTFRLRVRISLRPFTSNLEQVANLRCAQVNPAFYPSRDGK